MNYEAEAAQTKSDQFHGDLVPIRILNERLVAFIKAANDLDKVKKSLFYGKENAFGWRISEVENDCSGFDDTLKQDILHGVLGIATEAGELVEALNGKFDPVNVMEEVGDVMWYQAIICIALKTNLATIKAQNIAKLRTRFPDKFTEYDANNRDLSKERVVLEQTTRIGDVEQTNRIYSVADDYVNPMLQHLDE